MVRWAMASLSLLTPPAVCPVICAHPRCGVQCCSAGCSVYYTDEEEYFCKLCAMPSDAEAEETEARADAAARGEVTDVGDGDVEIWEAEA